MNRRRTATHHRTATNDSPATYHPDDPTATKNRTPVAGPRRTAMRGLTALLAGLLLTGALTACNNDSLACAKSAATIVGDIQDVEDAATNVGQISDASRRKDTLKALDRVQSDITKAGSKQHDAKVGTALTNLDHSVGKARSDAKAGRTVHVGAVAKAASKLTAVCTSG